MQEPASDRRVPEFHAISQRPDPLGALASKFATRVVGLEEAKRALLLSMLSADGAAGHVHVLIHGPGDSGKTLLLGHAASVAGMVKPVDQVLRGGAAAAGTRLLIEAAEASEVRVLPMDMLEHNDSLVLRAIERAVLAGRIRLWATTRDRARIAKVAPTLAHRFDLQPRVRRPHPKEMPAVVEKIALDQFRHEDEREKADQNFIRGFVRWGRTFVPHVADDERTWIRQVIGGHEQSQSAGRLAGIHESIERVAFCFARMRREDVSRRSIDDAISTVVPGFQTRP